MPSNKHHRTTKLHIRRGDTVKVLGGNHKGKQSVVVSVSRASYRAVVEGVNKVARHRKPSAKHPQGGIEQKEAPIHLSNLMWVDPATGEATRIGRRRNEEGKLERYAKTTGKKISNG